MEALKRTIGRDEKYEDLSVMLTRRTPDDGVIDERRPSSEEVYERMIGFNSLLIPALMVSPPLTKERLERMVSGKEYKIFSEIEGRDGWDTYVLERK